MALTTAARQRLTRPTMMTADEIAAANMAIAALQGGAGRNADGRERCRQGHVPGNGGHGRDANVTDVAGAPSTTPTQTMMLANAVTALQMPSTLPAWTTQAAVRRCSGRPSTPFRWRWDYAATELSAMPRSPAAMVELATATRTVMMAQGQG